MLATLLFVAGAVALITVGTVFDSDAKHKNGAAGVTAAP
jgi:hypothetical protein